jgi:hypothetical protein
MQTNLYIPKKIRVGFQKRSDTFTGKLGFVTYLDDKGVLRQEKSWEGWRDKKIAVQEFDNVPRSNFVFNKDVHRSGHWSSHSKVRIHDSRDFEFEIELSNMMYILMHADVSKRDIQEECVFAWSGRDLVLLPVNSDEYQKSIEHTRKQQVKFSLKDLTPGHTYSTKSHEEYVYLGHYEWCEKDYYKGWKNTGKKHVFYKEKKQSWEQHFVTLSGQELCECLSNEVHQKYAHFIDALMKTPHVKKMGKFAVKKGFEKVGYKNAAYESIIVTLIDGPKPDFNISMADFKIENNKPRIIRKKQDRGHYGYGYGRDENSRKKDHYLETMKKKGIKGNTYDELKQFFESAGFGVLYYTDTDGKKEVVAE